MASTDMDPRIPLDYAIPDGRREGRRDRGGCLVRIGLVMGVLGVFVAHETLTDQYAGLLERSEYLWKAALILAVGIVVIAFGVARIRRSHRADKDEAGSE